VIIAGANPRWFL